MSYAAPGILLLSTCVTHNLVPSAPKYPWQAQEGLGAALRAVLCERLAQVGWPPPITSAAAVGEPSGGQPGGQGWHGLEQADAQVPLLSARWWKGVPCPC